MSADDSRFHIPMATTVRSYNLRPGRGEDVERERERERETERERDNYRDVSDKPLNSVASSCRIIGMWRRNNG